MVSVSAVSECSELAVSAGLVSSCPLWAGEEALLLVSPSASSSGSLGEVWMENVYSESGASVISSFSCGSFVDFSVSCSDWIDLSIWPS